jgi:hypothetical protein
MHCKHCGNQIENDSKFCSFCGGKVEPISSIIPNPTIFSEPKSEPEISKQVVDIKGIQNENKLIIVGLIPLVSELINMLLRFTSNYELWDWSERIFGILIGSIPLMLSFYVKGKASKQILLIIGLILLAWIIFKFFIARYVL